MSPEPESSQTPFVKIDRNLLASLRDSALEAADALWALKEGKTPDRDPILINQEIHKLRLELNKILPSKTKTEA